MGGETKTATQPDATVELELKYSADWQGRGRGRRAFAVLVEENLLFVYLFVIFPQTTLSPIGNIELLSDP